MRITELNNLKIRKRILKIPLRIIKTPKVKTNNRRFKKKLVSAENRTRTFLYARQMPFLLDHPRFLIFVGKKIRVYIFTLAKNCSFPKSTNIFFPFFTFTFRRFVYKSLIKNLRIFSSILHTFLLLFSLFYLRYSIFLWFVFTYGGCRNKFSEMHTIFSLLST